MKWIFLTLLCFIFITITFISGRLSGKLECVNTEINLLHVQITETVETYNTLRKQLGIGGK